MATNEMSSEGAPDLDLLDLGQHERRLGTALWRTLDRLEHSIADRQIDSERAREIINLVAELAGSLSSPTAGERVDQLRESRIQPRTQGSSAYAGSANTKVTKKKSA